MHFLIVIKKTNENEHPYNRPYHFPSFPKHRKEIWLLPCVRFTQLKAMARLEERFKPVPA